MKSILIDYQKSASICDCVIHILVLLAQIGIQSRLSILRSNILECIDGVSLLHVDRFSLQNNIFSLFLELCDSDFSADILVSCRCFDICVKTLERVLRNENEDSDGQVTLKALRVIQSVASEGSNAMGPFLSTGGYGVLIQLWKATSGRATEPAGNPASSPSARRRKQSACASAGSRCSFEPSRRLRQPSAGGANLVVHSLLRSETQSAAEDGEHSAHSDGCCPIWKGVCDGGGVRFPPQLDALHADLSP